MNGKSVIRFGIQITKTFVKGAAAGTGILAPWVIAGVVIKRRIRKSFVKTTKSREDFFTRIMRKVEEAKDSVLDSVFDGETQNSSGNKTTLWDVKKTIKYVETLRDEGLSKEEIAEEVGVDVTVIHDLLPNVSEREQG
jgi:fructose-bisphosphate aldolase class 1